MPGISGGAHQRKGENVVLRRTAGRCCAAGATHRGTCADRASPICSARAGRAPLGRSALGGHAGFHWSHGSGPGSPFDAQSHLAASGVGSERQHRHPQRLVDGRGPILAVGVVGQRRPDEPGSGRQLEVPAGAVLVIQDDRRVRSPWCRCLACHDLEVECVPSAEAGLTLLACTPPRSASGRPPARSGVPGGPGRRATVPSGRPGQRLPDRRGVRPGRQWTWAPSEYCPSRAARRIPTCTCATCCGAPADARRCPSCGRVRSRALAAPAQPGAAAAPAQPRQPHPGGHRPPLRRFRHRSARSRRHAGSWPAATPPSAGSPRPSDTAPITDSRGPSGGGPGAPRTSTGGACGPVRPPDRRNLVHLVQGCGSSGGNGTNGAMIPLVTAAVCQYLWQGAGR